MTTKPVAETTEIVQLSPALAKEWLATNFNNRRLKPGGVRYLVGVINRGEWALGNDAICFDIDGRMINGQHRCHAIIETGQTLPVLVLRNASRKAQLGMDTGVKRQAGEQMHIMGIPGASTLKAALGRAVLNYSDDYGPTIRAEGISNAEIIELVQGDLNIDQAISLVNRLGSQIPSARVTIIALGYYLMIEAWPERVQDFHEKLSEGIELGANDPIRRFRNFLMSQARFASTTDRKKALALFIKVFNYWVDGKEIEALVWRTDEEWPTMYTKASYARVLQSRERGRKGIATRRARGEDVRPPGSRATKES